MALTVIRGYPTAPQDAVVDDPAKLRRIIRAIAKTLNQALQGRTNNIGDVTLTDSAATTTITDARITIQSHIGFMPLTANAATEYLTNGTMYCLEANVRNGSAVITHANNAQTDRKFRYVVNG